MFLCNVARAHRHHYKSKVLLRKIASDNVSIILVCYNRSDAYFLGLRDRTVVPALHISEFPIAFSSWDSFCL